MLFPSFQQFVDRELFQIRYLGKKRGLRDSNRSLTPLQNGAGGIFTTETTVQRLNPLPPLTISLPHVTRYKLYGNAVQCVAATTGASFRCGARARPTLAVVGPQVVGEQVRKSVVIITLEQAILPAAEGLAAAPADR